MFFYVCFYFPFIVAEMLNISADLLLFEAASLAYTNQKVLRLYVCSCFGWMPFKSLSIFSSQSSCDPVANHSESISHTVTVPLQTTLGTLEEIAC